MPISVPNTHQAIERLNDRWRPACRFFDQDDLRLRQVAKLGSALLKIDPAMGWAVLAGVAALQGDVTTAVDLADKAIRISRSFAIVEQRIAVLGNLDYFVEAGRLFREHLTSDALPQEFVGDKAVASGSILALDDVLRQAGPMPSVIPESIRKAIQLAAGILRRNNVTDEDVASWMEFAGTIMRENRRIFFGWPTLFATNEEDFGQVSLEFSVDVDSGEVAALNQALVERYIDAEVRVPECFTITFRSIPEAGERLAA